MQIQHTDFALSPSLRISLKRGRAREAVSQAQRSEADIPSCIAMAKAFRPNTKARSRLAQRLLRRPGIVAVRCNDDQGLSLVLRNTRHLLTRKDAADVFGEISLVYTSMILSVAYGSVMFSLQRASFGLHALERLFERSALSLDHPMLPAVDAEASRLFCNSRSEKTFCEDDDTFISAKTDGLWAGSWDHCAIEEDWNLRMVDPGALVPVFSARTFLAPEQMRPSVWLRWNDDPHVTMT